MLPFLIAFALTLLFTIKIESTEANSADSCINLKAFHILKSILSSLSTEAIKFDKITLLDFFLLRFLILANIDELIGIILLL
jgi:hypothetical protein